MRRNGWWWLPPPGDRRRHHGQGRHGSHGGDPQAQWNVPGPWDRVRHEVRGRRPGWRRRIHDEVRLYYGAHLHRRIFFSFGGVILFTVIEIALINHFLGVSVAGRPWRALLLFGIPTFLLWTASGRVARRMSRPIYELTRVAEKIGGGDLAARAPTGWMAAGEVGVLSRAINDMAARIAHQLGEQRELLAAVSHELRTPLARIRLLIEIARQAQAHGQGQTYEGNGRAGQGQGNGDDKGFLPAETLDEIERETVEIDTLVAELLASARLEFQALNVRPLDASEMAQRAVERAGLGPEKLRLPGTPCSFKGDPTLVARALANLIDNARKHARGLDLLSVSMGDGFVVFAVSDRGPGFAPGDETRIFASFYRGAGAREDDQQPDQPRAGTAGTADSANDKTTPAGMHGASAATAHRRSHNSLGLGLSLVKRIAQAHGGDVTAANRPEGGATFILRLAITPPERARTR